MQRLLGGSASPAGWVVAFLQAPKATVLDEIRAWLPGTRRVADGELPFPECLDVLEPFSVPAFRELYIACEGGWTAQLSNHTDGGDPTAPAPYLSDALGVRCLIATHSPMHGPGHGGAQLWVHGPDGEPPLMYERTIDAVCKDGRWSWEVSGPPLPFEDPTRYQARRIRDRFNREALVDCLAKAGIRVDDDAFYGPATVVELPRGSRQLERTRTAALDWLQIHE